MIWVPLKISAKGNNKRKAQQKLKDVLSEIERKQADASTDMLFLDWIERWMEQKKNDVRSSTLESYRLTLNCHIIPYFESRNYTLRTLTAQNLQDYYNHKMDSGLSADTVKKHSAVINGALKEAYKKDLIAANPYDKVTLPRKKKGSRFRGNAYSLEEVKRMITSIPEDDPLRPAVILGTFYGLRRSEVLGLRWKDINFINKTIFIQNTVTQVVSVHECEETKNECSTRTLAIIPGTEKYFRELMAMQKEWLYDAGEPFSLENPICIWPDGSRLKPSYISNHFRLLLEKNNLRKIRFHDLRHTAGSLLLDSGVDIKTIQEFLGHSQASTTLNIYLHSIVRGGQVVAQTMEKIIAS
jgi:integrase